MNDTASVIAGAIPVVGGIVSNAISSANANRANAQAREWSIQDWNRDWQANFDHWNRQNEYNSPKAQMKRLREAGLNPALMHGQASNNVAQPVAASRSERTPVSVAPTPDYGFLGNSALGAYMNLKKVQPEINLMEAQATHTAVDAALKGFQQGLIAQQTKTEKHRTDTQFYETNIANKREKQITLETDWMADTLDDRVNLTKSQSAAAKLEVERLAAEIPILERRDAREALMVSMNAKEAAARILHIAAETSKNRDEAERIRAETRKVLSEFYDPARNDNSMYYYNQVGRTVSGALQAAGAGTAFGGATRLFKGTKSIPKPSHKVNEYPSGASSTTYYR